MLSSEFLWVEAAGRVQRRSSRFRLVGSPSKRGDRRSIPSARGATKRSSLLCLRYLLAVTWKPGQMPSLLSRNLLRTSPCHQPPAGTSPTGRTYSAADGRICMSPTRWFAMKPAPPATTSRANPWPPCPIGVHPRPSAAENSWLSSRRSRPWMLPTGFAIRANAIILGSRGAHPAERRSCGGATEPPRFWRAVACPHTVWLVFGIAVRHPVQSKASFSPQRHEVTKQRHAPIFVIRSNAAAHMLFNIDNMARRYL